MTNYSVMLDKNSEWKGTEGISYIVNKIRESNKDSEEIRASALTRGFMNAHCNTNISNGFHNYSECN